MVKINISVSYDVKITCYREDKRTRYSASVIIGSTLYNSGRMCSKKTALYALVEMIRREYSDSKNITVSGTGRGVIY